MSETTIPDAQGAALLAALDSANSRVMARFPGDLPGRQPVHTVYGGAHLFKADAAQKLGSVALRVLAEHAPDADTFSEALELDRAVLDRIYQRVVEKLTREPVEDFRIDFEDGFGTRPDAEEDGFAVAAANEVAAGLAAGTLPPSIGIRIKPFSEELKRRSLRTFDVFLTRLLDRTGGMLPPNFVVTLPKITAPEQVAALASACDAFEFARQLPSGLLRFELMIETTQSVFAPDGTVALPRLVAEAQGRMVAAHFGTYDYTAACGITAAHQHMQHPVCDFAKHVMQVSLAGSGIWLSDGATNIMPIGSRDAVPGRSLASARPARPAFAGHRLLSGMGSASGTAPESIRRGLRVFRGGARRGVGPSEELRAEGGAGDARRRRLRRRGHRQGLLNYFLRALSCGAISEDEAVAMSGLTLDELRGRSFVKILAARRSS